MSTDSPGGKPPGGSGPATVVGHGQATVVARDATGEEWLRGPVPLETRLVGTEQAERMIHEPTPEDVALTYRLASGRYCETCNHFDLELGQRMAAQERFWGRIKHEHGWSGGARWTGPVPDYGLCKWLGDAMVFRYAPADPDPTKPGSGCPDWRANVRRVLYYYARSMARR